MQHIQNVNAPGAFSTGRIKNLLLNHELFLCFIYPLTLCIQCNVVSYCRITRTKFFFKIYVTNHSSWGFVWSSNAAFLPNPQGKYIGVNLYLFIGKSKIGVGCSRSHGLKKAKLDIMRRSDYQATALTKCQGLV